MYGATKTLSAVRRTMDTQTSHPRRASDPAETVTITVRGIGRHTLQRLDDAARGQRRSRNSEILRILELATEPAQRVA